MSTDKGHTMVAHPHTGMAFSHKKGQSTDTCHDTMNLENMMLQRGDCEGQTLSICSDGMPDRPGQETADGGGPGWAGGRLHWYQAGHSLWSKEIF